MAVKLGELIIELTAKSDAFAKGMADAKNLAFTSSGDIVSSLGRIGDSLAKLRFDNAAQIQRSLQTIGTVTAGLGIGVGGALGLIVEKSIAAASKTYELAQATGLSSKTLSAFSFVAKQSGIDTETMAKGLERLSKNAFESADGNSKSAKAFQTLGITVTDSAGRLKPINDLIGEVAGKFSVMENGSTKTALAMELFGRSGAALIPILNRGKQGIAELTDEAKRLGLVLDDETTRRAHELDEAMGRVKSTFTGMALQLTSGMIPALYGLSEAFTDAETHGAGMKKLGEDIGGAFTAVAKGFELAALFAARMDLAMERIANHNPISLFGLIGFRTNRPDEEIDAQINALNRQYNKLSHALDNPPTPSSRISKVFLKPGVEQTQTAEEILAAANLRGGAPIIPPVGSSKDTDQTNKFTEAIAKLRDEFRTLAGEGLDPAAKALEDYRQALEKIANTLTAIPVPQNLEQQRLLEVATRQAEQDRGVALDALNRKLTDAEHIDENRIKILKEMADAAKGVLSVPLQPLAPALPTLSRTPDFAAGLARQIPFTDLTTATERYEQKITDVYRSESLIVQDLQKAGATQTEINNVTERYDQLRAQALETMKQEQIIQDLQKRGADGKTTFGGGAQAALIQYTERIRDNARTMYDAMTQALGGIENSFTAFFDDLGRGAKGLGQAFVDLGKGIARSLLGAIETIIVRALIMQALLLALSKLGIKIKEPDYQSDANKQKAANFQKASSDAGVAGAEEFTFALAQSFGNLAYAAEMGAAAYAIGMGFAGLSMLAKGGPVMGPGTATSDSVPAMLSSGEFVVKAEAVRAIGMANLSAMNEGRIQFVADGMPKAATGGFVINNSPVPTSIAAGARSFSTSASTQALSSVSTNTTNNRGGDFHYNDNSNYSGAAPVSLREHRDELKEMIKLMVRNKEFDR